MEDVLDQYDQPYDPKHPLICFDERPCQLIDDVIVPIPMKPGKPRKRDYEYKRNGVCSILIAFEHHTGKRFIKVLEHRTMVDYALFMKWLLQQYPDAESMKVVQDNLNTHTKASFYKTFLPQEAFELSKKFEFHYTPKKGSWLNMVEIEISALSRQCLNRRISNIKKMAKEVSDWENERNRIKATVHWEFTKEKAREKLQRHYHMVQN
jgi:hypothetical protein